MGADAHASRGARKPRQKVDVDGGRWIPLPLAVLKSAAYLHLSDAAKVLLIEIAFQYLGDNNGRMLLSRKHLASRNILSADRIHRAKAELLESRLIMQTVAGQRPNKASWYAATWWKLDELPGFDPGVRTAFIRGAYKATAAKEKRAAPQFASASKIVDPAPGTERAPVAPATGTVNAVADPAAGAIRGGLTEAPVPVAGHLLEVTSTRRRRGPPLSLTASFDDGEYRRMTCVTAECSQCVSVRGELHRVGCAQEACPRCRVSTRYDHECNERKPRRWLNATERRGTTSEPRKPRRPPPVVTGQP